MSLSRRRGASGSLKCASFELDSSRSRKSTVSLLVVVNLGEKAETASLSTAQNSIILEGNAKKLPETGAHVEKYLENPANRQIKK